MGDRADRCADLLDYLEGPLSEVLIGENSGRGRVRETYVFFIKSNNLLLEIKSKSVLKDKRRGCHTEHHAH